MQTSFVSVLVVIEVQVSGGWLPCRGNKVSCAAGEDAHVVECLSQVVVSASACGIQFKRDHREVGIVSRPIQDELAMPKEGKRLVLFGVTDSGNTAQINMKPDRMISVKTLPT
eukprot:733049-Rhodomonas_salina.3